MMTMNIFGNYKVAASDGAFSPLCGKQRNSIVGVFCTSSIERLTHKAEHQRHIYPTDSHNDHPLIGSKCNIRTTHFLPTASEVTIEPSSHSCLGACKGLRRRGRLILNIKIVEDYNGGDLYQKHLYQKHKGILVDTYVYSDGSQVTAFKWEKQQYVDAIIFKAKPSIFIDLSSVFVKKYYFYKCLSTLDSNLQNVVCMDQLYP